MSKDSRERHRAKILFFNYLKETALVVDPYVRTFLQGLFTSSAELLNALLTRYRFGRPQLRPALVRLAYELVGGEDWRITIPACGAMELKDTSYYCYDDVLDQGADPAQVVLGGVFNSASYRMLLELRSSVSANVLPMILGEACRLDENNAQAAAIEKRLRRPDPHAYNLKAAGYNFWEQAFRIGGMIAGANQEQTNTLGRAGKLIGTAYIISNDCWDFGKDLEDFKSGKFTLPSLLALRIVPEDQRQTLFDLMGKPFLSDPEIVLIRSILVENGVIEEGMRRANKLCQRALELLGHFPGKEAQSLVAFSTTMTQKNKYFKVLENLRVKKG